MFEKCFLQNLLQSGACKLQEYFSNTLQDNKKCLSCMSHIQKQTFLLYRVISAATCILPLTDVLRLLHCYAFPQFFNAYTY